MHEHSARYAIAIAHPRYAPVAHEDEDLANEKIPRGTCATGVIKKRCYDRTLKSQNITGIHCLFQMALLGTKRLAAKMPVHGRKRI